MGPRAAVLHVRLDECRRGASAAGTSAGVLDVGDVGLDLQAVLPGRFSVAGTTPSALTFAPAFASAHTVAIATAPPVMSPFIRCMPSGSFSEMPPESNVIPFPTTANSYPLPPRPW